MLVQSSLPSSPVPVHDHVFRTSSTSSSESRSTISSKVIAILRPDQFQQWRQPERLARLKQRPVSACRLSSGWSSPFHHFFERVDRCCNPAGVTLGFGLRHAYPFPRTWDYRSSHKYSSRKKDPLEVVTGCLKGTDAALFAAFEALELQPRLRFVTDPLDGRGTRAALLAASKAWLGVWLQLYRDDSDSNILLDHCEPR
ncbi:hypothetical protein C8Q74DRAFT_2855 [Fomes fomentarius]|nr:hypothetical protein C8Q74DRAFT_2855 [Fomes fomentarius]